MYSLLIVDDKEVFRRMIIRMSYFEDNQDKFRIKHLAQNGLEALGVLDTGDIDIVLTDIRMPLMNGIELLKAINKKKLCKCTIFLSEYSDFSYAKEGIINGAFDYIVKPVDNAKLKITFDRAYEYMHSFVDKDNLFASSIVKLAGNMISADDDLFLTILNTVTGFIRQNSNSCTEMQLVMSNVLEKLHYQIMINHAFVKHYIPLKKICVLDRYVRDEGELFEIFNKKVTLLRNELAKFRLAVSCPLINEIWYYVISNIESTLNLQCISERFYVNKKYLSTLFKKETGMRYIDFITYFKIERAKMLLSYSNLKIYNIAELLGFTDTEYFSKVFKKQTGLTPSSFNWDCYML